VAASLSDEGLARLTADMDPAMLALVRRHDPIRQADLWGRPIGWGNLDISSPPDLGFDHAVDQAAQEINALRPFSRLPIRPMPPLVLAAALVDQDRALTCLTQAVYYEAAREPLSGQEAVAQVVLNRMRHPAYPKSVCGVVYQGSARITGCQFTFTCDGSLGREPEPGLWSQALPSMSHPTGHRPWSRWPRSELTSFIGGRDPGGNLQPLPVAMRATKAS
jgi:spore germination cell wall hydrolase CwlJ-like protein